MPIKRERMNSYSLMPSSYRSLFSFFSFEGNKVAIYAHREFITLLTHGELSPSFSLSKNLLTHKKRKGKKKLTFVGLVRERQTYSEDFLDVPDMVLPINHVCFDIGTCIN